MELADKLRQKIDNKTKPLGALGKLEKLAFQVGRVQNTLSPTLQNPTIVVFAGDHGIAQAGVSAYPQEVTYQMVLNFLRGGAAINVFCRQNHLALHIVDAGVKQDFQPQNNLIIAKAGYGTRNFLHKKAMSKQELDFCLAKGAEIVKKIAENGCNVIGFGEMGIGNTSAASMLMSYLCNLPLEKCVGKGTGVSEERFLQKIQVLQKAQNLHQNLSEPLDILQTFAGFEMVQMCGAMLEAYRQNMLILVDGFIATSVFLVAKFLEPTIQQNAIFCHQSSEAGHKLMLDFLQAEPLLHLDMRLGEGTGCAVAFPIIQSAVNFLNEMASFESAGVSKQEA
ncbi:MAG: nicotinate-nucleotide--dimethylbenzimidazole phosphoribosyltransferase [Raineya sp.]|nr:nicotinate-nucleotide--dimethylbenzimidazole phosphoribosyltransferase [Raineya sp.]MDW8297401.1 nicotinate-nucleotide--dimethylbenzimidazole phosphoribosyltransferase [Raineya sp.]